MTVHNADCRTVIADMPDDSVDLILTDPPYGTTNLNLDKNGAPDVSFYKSLMRILKPTGWFFCFAQIEMMPTILAAGWKYRFNYVWIKPRLVFTHPTTKPYYQHEIILACIRPDLKKVSDLYYDIEALKTTGKSYTHGDVIPKSEYSTSQGHGIVNIQGKVHSGRMPTTILHAPNKCTMKFKERTPHPTQKPLSLCETIIKGYCPPDGLVFDPFAGSGTTLIAAYKLLRRYQGCELNPEYYKIITDRLGAML